ncbi:MAG: cytidine deaminase [Pirellulales bacterium]
MSNNQHSDLTQAAIEARRQAYAPYSQFAVGAALLTASGEIISGANVENASYGMTICAERTAIFSAVSRGLREYTAIAVATPGGHSPCGACRQVLAEFAPDLLILLVDSNHPDQAPRQLRLSELLPHSFQFSGPAAGGDSVADRPTD